MASSGSMNTQSMGGALGMTPPRSLTPRRSITPLSRRSAMSMFGTSPLHGRSEQEPLDNFGRPRPRDDNVVRARSPRTRDATDTEDRARDRADWRRDNRRGGQNDEDGPSILRQQWDLELALKL